MTPKEKAEELLKKMDVIHYVKLGGKNKDSKGLPVSMHDDQVKQCALIAVDEILNELFEMALVTGSSYVHKHIDYYQEVKQEIEKL